MDIRYRLVIFDLDGTLVDTRDDLANTVNATLQKLGEPLIAPEGVHGLVGHGVRVLMQRSLSDKAQARLEEAVPLFLDHYRRHLLDCTKPYPGMEETLEQLKSLGCVMAVLTNKPEEMSLKILEGLGLLSFFSALVGGDSLPTRKPDPEGLLHLCARAQMEKSRSLLVGDSDVDVETGRSAGVRTCGVSWGFGSLDGCHPDYVISCPRELVGIVAALTQLPNG